MRRRRAGERRPGGFALLSGALTLGLLAAQCRRPAETSQNRAAPSASARREPVCPLAREEQALVDALGSDSSPASELARLGLFARHGCQGPFAEVEKRLGPHWVELESGDFARYAALVAPTDVEKVLRSLKRRSAEAPYPTQSGLALRNLLRWVDCSRPEQGKLVGEVARALIKREAVLAPVVTPEGKAGKMTTAQEQTLAENRDALSLLGSATLGLSRCTSNRELGDLLLGVLKRAQRRLWPKNLVRFFGLGETIQMLAELWGPDRTELATEIAVSESLRDGTAICTKKLASWQALGFSLVSYTNAMARIGRDEELVSLRDCVQKPLLGYAVPKDARGLQELARDLPALVRVSPDAASKLGERTLQGLGRVKIQKVTLDVTLAELVRTELLSGDRVLAEGKLCQLLTQEFSAPPATLQSWRRLAAAEAARACPAESAPYLGLPKPEEVPGDFVELVRRLGGRDRLRALTLAAGSVGRVSGSERVALAARLLFVLSCSDCEP